MIEVRVGEEDPLHVPGMLAESGEGAHDLGRSPREAAVDEGDGSVLVHERVGIDEVPEGGDPVHSRGEGDDGRLAHGVSVDSAIVRVVDSVVELIGNTPLVRLRSVSEGIPCPVYAKVEYFNPGGSVKDRIATRMILRPKSSCVLRWPEAETFCTVRWSAGGRCGLVFDSPLSKDELMRARWLDANLDQIERDHWQRWAREFVNGRAGSSQ